MTRDGARSQRGPKRSREVVAYRFDDGDGAGWLLGLAIGTALAGGAARIGLTRDGGALAVGMYLGDDYATEYVKPDEDLGQAVREIAQAWGIAIPIWDDEAGCYVVPLARQNGRK